MSGGPDGKAESCLQISAADPKASIRSPRIHHPPPSLVNNEPIYNRGGMWSCFPNQILGPMKNDYKKKKKKPGPGLRR
jgi:hypothetical protein